MNKGIYGLPKSGTEIKTVPKAESASKLIQIPHPIKDFYRYDNYLNWAMGLPGSWSQGDKWTTLSTNGNPDYLQFQLMGGSANGTPISHGTPFPIETVTNNTLYYRDDGYGSCPANYTDYMNRVFKMLGLNTTAIGSNDGYLHFRFDYCRTDDFTLVFKETGILDGSSTNLTNPMFYTIGTLGGFGMIDSIVSTNELDAYRTLSSGHVLIEL
jgi:hypothetical protein